MKGILLTIFAGSMLLAGCKKDKNEPETPDSKTFTVTVTNASVAKDYFESGVFNTPVGSTAPGPALPGNSYEATFHAGIGHKLSFATMFVQSNDLFFAPSGAGIELYSNGNPVSGDITNQILLWDAGTEVNEMPGTGANQPPRQTGPNTGPAENGTVREISNVNDGFTYPATSTTIKASLDYMGDETFKLTIENLAGSTSPLAPGVFVVHTAENPLFTAGVADLGQGLEGLAEDGDASILGASSEAATGYFSPLAPGVFAIHKDGVKPLFTNNSADYGDGLEGLSEDGSPGDLATSLSNMDAVSASGMFNTPTGASAPGPLLPGASYTFSFTAEEGDHLSFATMLVQTNDLFYAPAGAGFDLWANGSPRTGDVTSLISLWDAGTETNEFPGAGANQAPRQSGPDTGADENGTVRAIDNVNDGYSYPNVTDAIRVSIAVQ